MIMKTGIPSDISVVFLARGAELDWRVSCERFLDSYHRSNAGIKHSLVVIFKGFSHPSELKEAKRIFGTTGECPEPC